MLEQTENLPILSFSLAPVCKHIRRYFGDDLHDGDVISLGGFQLRFDAEGAIPAGGYAQSTEATEEVIVTAEYRPVSVQQLPASVTVLDQQFIERRGAEHLEQLLNLAPNVNLSTGASRGRFVLIRGIGERQQHQLG